VIGLDDNCPEKDCDGTLSTSQFTLPIKHEGLFIYETYRRCIKCRKTV